MSELFLSYASEDFAVAKQVAQYLRDEGWSVFWDREIPVGKTWENVIEEQLLRAHCVVVLWSAASVVSEWVRAEAAAAADRGVLVPALIDASSPPLRFRIIQAANLVGWHGRREHMGWQHLIAGVRALAEFDREPQAGLTATRQTRRSPAKTVAIAEVETGTDRGRSLVLTQGMTSVTIGRSRDCDFVLDDYYVSRTHCRIQIQHIKASSQGQDAYRFTLIDCGSPAGTHLNDEHVDRAELRHGDHFQIGGVRFRFRIVAEGTA
jgi:TIR domain/FHA domain